MRQSEAGRARILVGILVVTALTGCTAVDCANRAVAAYPSPGNELTATVFTRQCAAGHATTEISIHPSGVDLPAGEGNVFRAKLRADITPSPGEVPLVTLQWFGRNRLRIGYDRRTQVIRQEEDEAAVVIDYQVATTLESRPADLVVSVGGGAISAPDSIAPGWTRIRVDEDGQGHIVVLFRLREDTGLPDFLTAMDTAPATPAMAVALGGPEVGDTGEFITELTPGRYVLGCVRGSGGHRHAATGESKLVVVTGALVGAGRRNPPQPTRQIGMADFAYTGPDHWSAGQHLLRIENTGRQDHQLRLLRLNPGVSVERWLEAEAPDDLATPVAGLARTGPGAVAYLPLDLAPGSYVAYCLVTDPESRKMHIEMGMRRLIQVR